MNRRMRMAWKNTLPPAFFAGPRNNVRAPGFRGRVNEGIPFQPLKAGASVSERLLLSQSKGDWKSGKDKAK